MGRKAKGVVVEEEAEMVFRFAKGVEGAPSLHDDERLATLAVCIAMQQQAGFKEYIDLRQCKCPQCGAAGFNTGWGVWRFACGGEYHTDEEGTPAIACTRASAALGGTTEP